MSNSAGSPVSATRAKICRSSGVSCLMVGRSSVARLPAASSIPVSRAKAGLTSRCSKSSGRPCSSYSMRQWAKHSIMPLTISRYASSGPRRSVPVTATPPQRSTPPFAMRPPRAAALRRVLPGRPILFTRAVARRGGIRRSADRRLGWTMVAASALWPYRPPQSCLIAFQTALATVCAPLSV